MKIMWNASAAERLWVEMAEVRSAQSRGNKKTHEPDEETLDPQDWGAFRQIAHGALDRMLDVQEHIRERPVWQQIPDHVEERFLEGPPMKAGGAEAAVQDFNDLVLPYPTGNVHPRFWGWAGGAGTPMGMLAELLAGGMNSVSGIFNDAAARVDVQVVDWMKEVMGFPENASGVTTSGGSVANLIGIAVGRDAKAGYDVAKRGIGVESRLVFYASEEVHASVPKAAQVLGLGRDALRMIPVDDEFRIVMPELEAAIARDRQAGLVPFAVVGNAGTINTGAIDPLDELADLAAREGLWFHVDGAFGAMAALSPETRHLVKGMERADSLAFDFHKWLSVQYEVGCVLVRDGEWHRRTFTVPASYLKPLPRGTGAQQDSTTLRSLQLSRGFKALKAWMSIKEHGFEKLGRMVSKNVAQARYLESLVDVTPELELLAPVSLNVVCFRFRPDDGAPEALDELNQEILMRVQESGLAVPSGRKPGGRFAIAACICNHRSVRADFELLVRETLRHGRAIVAERSRVGGSAHGSDGRGRTARARERAS